MHVLVHIDLDQGLGPIGAWGYDGKLRHFYPESLDTSISARARSLMAQRDTDVTVPDWMDLLADTDVSPLDDFESFDASDNETLPLILAEYRSLYLASD